MSRTPQPKVHVRTPTFKRDKALNRCLESLRAQTWKNWVCDVYDDDPDGSGRATCEAIGDERIRYHRNARQKFASKNIDGCFTADNPHDADYFFVLEDDNLVFPEFIEENIRVCRENGVKLVLRNQLIEFASGTPGARLSRFGIFDNKYFEKTYEPDEFRLSLIAGIGTSNGGLFWSRLARSKLEIGFDCTATLQEYMRTFSIADPIYVALDPLAVWAQNAEQTMRDMGNTTSFLRRELDLKRAIQILQQNAWKLAAKDKRSKFLKSQIFAYSDQSRATGLMKSLISRKVGRALTLSRKAELLARGILIRTAGRPSPDLFDFISSRTG